jgi:tetratricopeptide (TPR) repeat protein
MTRERDGSPEDDALLPRLDSEPGPMPPLTAAESEALAWSVVSRWSASVPGVEAADADAGPAPPLPTELAERMARAVLRRRAMHAAKSAIAAAAVLCSIAGISFAAYKLWPAAHEPAADATMRAAHSKLATIKPAILDAGLAQTAETPADPPAAALEASARGTTRDANPNAAAELLARANTMRAQRRWAAAERDYRKALRSGATDAQRYVALVAAASLALTHRHRPLQALELYKNALALSPDGPLSEEARYGVAESYRALGDEMAEAAALNELVTEHPESWLAKGARRRLAELKRDQPAD